MKFVLSFSIFLSLGSFAVEPMPKTPTQEKLEETQQTGGALKIETEPATIEGMTHEDHDPHHSGEKDKKLKKYKKHKEKK